MENNYIELAGEILKSFFEEENDYSIKMLDSDEFDYYMLIMIDSSKCEKLENSNRIFKSIEKILKAYANKNNKKIKVEFDSF